MQAKLFSVYDAAAAAAEALAVVQEHLTLTLNRNYYEADEIESMASQLDALLMLESLDLSEEDLVSGENVFFSATGVTDGDLLQGVRNSAGGCTTQSIVMRSESGTVRMIEAYHRLTKLNEYSAVDFTGDTAAAYPLP